MSMGKSQRARGGNRGGCGGGYEATNPDYEDQKLARMAREYASLQTTAHRELYLGGLSKWEQQQVPALAKRMNLI